MNICFTEKEKKKNVEFNLEDENESFINNNDFYEEEEEEMEEIEF